MITFLDNTGVHRINLALKSKKKLRLVDAFALLHFAENILFAEKMLVSSFERRSIKEVTEETVSLLNEIGCIQNDTENQSGLLEIVDFSKEQYIRACDKAKPLILQNLTFRDTSITSLGYLADSATQPKGIKKSVLQKWILEDWKRERRREMVHASTTNMTAKKAYDYILSSDDIIYKTLKDRTRKLKSTPNVAHFLDVFFRIAINEQLAEIKSGVYTPAPQRANIIEKSDSLFRHAMLKRIENAIVSSHGKFASQYLEEIRMLETLPIPLFAICLLDRKEKEYDSPKSFLVSARKLRDDPIIKNIREWLDGWELMYNSEDKGKKARHELDKIAQDIQLDIGPKPPWYSILRFGIQFYPDNGAIVFDPIGLEPFIRTLMNRMTLRKIFLSILTDKFSLDDKIGAKLFKKLNRVIILK